MPGNSFGELFKITTFGESHGGAVGVVVDGCPAGVEITEQEIQRDLDRRRPGQSSLSTPRKEEDKISILSGVFEGKTTGTPILMLAHNKDVKSSDYDELKNLYRPGHADFTYIKKYGFRDWRGSGRASARETLARVAAGALAKKILAQIGISTVAYVEQVGDIASSIDPLTVREEDVEKNDVRCPDDSVSRQMIALIEQVKAEGDSIGGIIRGVVTGVPAGLGEPVFDKLHADLGKAMLSINAAKGFDIGLGFKSVGLRGSQHNDAFQVAQSGSVSTVTNNAGGVLGGISNGQALVFRVVFKPVSTIALEQSTITTDRQATTVKGVGRHDPCVLPRAVPIVEAMAALVVLDHVLRHNSTLHF